MMSMESIRRHYEAGLGEVGPSLNAVTPRLPEHPRTADLAPLDQFHAGGLEATATLAEMAAPRPGFDVLDAGSGLGGPARFLAGRYGCRVIGVDLSPGFVDIARDLTERAGLAGRVCFRVGDLLALPFEDAVFDLVWTQHVAMNIPDRLALYREFARVLKPGGRLAFHDPLLGEEGLEVVYPTPWASESAASHLLGETETRRLLKEAGFALRAFEDVTRLSLEAFARQASAPPPTSPSLAQVLGPRGRPMLMNFARNLAEGRVRVAMGVAERT